MLQYFGILGKVLIIYIKPMVIWSTGYIQSQIPIFKLNPPLKKTVLRAIIMHQGREVQKCMFHFQMQKENNVIFFCKMDYYHFKGYTMQSFNNIH